MTEARIDIVGHFGTTFSYATVGSRVARALRDVGLLGSVSNIDAEWHPDHEDLRQSPETGTHVLLFTAPHHYLDIYAKRYGRDRSAIFMSPNTDSLNEEHATTCACFGLSLAPSSWCQRTVLSKVPDAHVRVLPLGVPDKYAQSREKRRGLLAAGLSGRCRVLHFSTDQWWPGRKGTQELLATWAHLTRGIWKPLETESPRLTLHVPPSLLSLANYEVRALQIDQSVNIVTGKKHGGDEDLFPLFNTHDLVVAPSRCEGFGMMLLASLVAGVPLLCTYNTGHVDYLADHPGWMGIPTAQDGFLAGEEGSAPVVEVQSLATALSVACTRAARECLLIAGHDEFDVDDDGSWGTWSAALPYWTEALMDWTEETA